MLVVPPGRSEGVNGGGGNAAVAAYEFLLDGDWEVLLDLVTGGILTLLRDDVGVGYYW